MIECYFSECPNHGVQHKEEGPFCNLNKCEATMEQLEEFTEKRELYLKDLYDGMKGNGEAIRGE